MTRRLIGIYLVGLVLVNGCAQKKEGSGKEIIIKFMNWESTPEGQKLINSLIQEFEKKNPGIKINSNVVSGGTGTYSSKLMTMFAGGVAPDIFEIQIEMIVPFIEKGLVLTLDRYIQNSHAVKEKDFYPVTLYNFRYIDKLFGRGYIYGLPKDFGTVSLIYNKDLFDRAGIPYPDRSLNWDEYLEIAKRMTIYDEQGRLKQIGIETIDRMHLLLQAGGRLWSEDYNKCLLDSPEAIEAFQFYYDLTKKYRVALKEMEKPGGIGTTTIDFFSGKVGLSTQYRYSIPDFKVKIGNRFNWGLAPYLHYKNRLSYLYGPSGWSIFSKTKHPDECWKFMEILVGREGQSKAAQLGWNIPVNREIALSEYFLNNPNHPSGINKVFLEEVKYTVPGIVNPYLTTLKLNILMDEELNPEKIERDGGKVDVALKRLTNRINAEITEKAKDF